MPWKSNPLNLMLTFLACLTLFSVITVFPFPSLNQMDPRYSKISLFHRNTDDNGNQGLAETFTLATVNFSNPTPHEKIVSPEIPIDTYIPKLNLSWGTYCPNHFNFLIRDADKERPEMPFKYPFSYPKHPLSDFKDSNFEFEFNDNPLSLVLKRKDTKEIIFELSGRLVYTDLYIEWTFTTPTNHLYGLGEREGALHFHPGTYTLFIVDRSGVVDDGKPGLNTNGQHSVYLMREKSGKYHTCLFRNIHPQELVIGEDNRITWKAIGGVLDLSFFLGETPEESVSRYHEYIGGWSLPALWHLGIHQSKWWGYSNIDDLAYVMSEYDRVKLPLDVVWSDLDYLSEAVNFAFDEKNFPPDRMRELFAKYKKRWVPVIQAYIPTYHSSYAWTYPNVTDLAVRDGENQSQPSIGRTHGGPIMFIDFFHPESEKFWHLMHEYLDSKMDLSGVWLDANEVSNLAHNEQEHQDSHRKYYKLPFFPGSRNLYELSVIDLDAIHYGGVTEYNVRPITCLYQSEQSYKYLQRKHRFPFVLTRGSMMGSGQFAYHFTADVFSDWESMRASFAQVLNFNILGMPGTGADICGMIGKHATNEELCSRWYQIATYFSFHRNHHQPQEYEDGPQSLNLNFQEPYRYTGVWFETIAAAILQRFSILKQFYALFFMKKEITADGLIRGTGTIVRPLFFGFPMDTNMPSYGHKIHETQFLFGDIFMVAPATYKGMTEVNVYFPDWRWFDLKNYTEVKTRGGFQNVSAKLPEVAPYFLRGGQMLFKQGTDDIRRVEDLNNTFMVIAGLSDLRKEELHVIGESNGYILSASSYEEEYIYQNCALKTCMLKIKLSYDLNQEDLSTTITFEINAIEPTSDATEIGEIYVLGVDSQTIKHSNKIVCDGCGQDRALTLEKGEDWIKIRPSRLYSLTDGVKYKFTLTQLPI